MQERRKYIRLEKPISIAYTRTQSSEKEKLSYSKNIGKGGVCLVLYEELKESDTLDLKIYLPEDKIPVNTRGKVVWINEFTTEGMPRGQRMFYAGVEFTAMDEQQVEKINDYISSVQ
jgi:c-di-GMP-binding flagellar brake protein YcgR